MTLGSPNILYLHCHDAGRYVQPYGYAVATPNLQNFAEQGMLFRQAFCANPTCSPSRACLLTGQHAHVNGMLGLAHRGFTMDDYESTLVHFLSRHGFHTALVGIQHIAREPYASPKQIGYEEILVDGGDPISTTECAEAFLAREHDRPFFLDVGYFPPHRSGDGFPYLLPVPEADYVKPPDHLPNTPETRQDFAEYMASVATFDAMAGRVLQALERNGQADNTLIIVTTDHGIAFPNMKCHLTDHGTGVMLMLRGPGGFTGGKSTDAMVSHMDIFPTLCECLNLPVPGSIQGKSLLPLARDPQSTIHDELFMEVNVHAASEPMRAVRTTRWKFIRRQHDRDRPTLPNCDNGPTKTILHNSGWAERLLPREELYDLLFDPTESRNLIDDPNLTEIAGDLRRRLDRWMVETKDPLLQGPLNLSDKQVTDSDAYSP